MSTAPPAVPHDALYTSHFCEENAYLLAQYFGRNPAISAFWDISAVIFSNHTKTVALWNQRLSKILNQPVVWDYHVVVILRLRSSSQSWVYDFDTRLGIPVTWDLYFSQTFSRAAPEIYQSMFRVVPAELYLDGLASDRSHMRDTTVSATAVYLKPPPPYPPLQGSSCIQDNVTHNLMDFISMSPSVGYGDVVDLRTMHDMFSAKTDDEISSE